jgi:hypothetical protein
VGAAATAVLVGRRRLAGPIELGAGIAGGAIAAVAASAAFGPVVALLVIAGAGRSFLDVAVRTLLQRSVRDEILARAFGLQEGLSMLCLAIGAAAVPIFISLFGTRGALVAAGVFLPAIALGLFASLRGLDRRAVLPDPARLALLRSISLFQPLEQPALELLVHRLIPVQVPAGTVVIREGDVGEIALLRDVPRTATVTALTDLHLLALEREEFLAAVTGSRPSAEAAHETVERRLSEQAREDR